jgi:hypothetical protein
MPPAPSVITKPKLLLGEGVDEVRFFDALLKHLKITDIQVQEYGGKNKLGAYLKALVTPVPGFAQVVSLAVTRDADTDATGAFQSVCYALQSAGLPAPAAHGLNAGVNPEVHAFIMPDGQAPGMLEDLCLASVATDPALPCVDAFFRCVLSAAKRQPNNKAKASLHAWLASQAIPDKRLGEAAEAGYWPWHDPAFLPLIQFLQAGPLTKDSFVDPPRRCV